MTNESYFFDMLRPDRLEKMREEYRFRYLQPLEKLVRGYEIIYHMRDLLPDCAVRGGMAAQLHLKSDRLRRLSEDVDVVTGRSRDEVDKAIERVSHELGWAKPEPHMPRKKDPRKNIPLLTYYCKYRSVTGEPTDIKIEIFYGNDMSLTTERTDSTMKIFGIPIGFSIPIYGMEELIGDKMTTLPLQTIGIGERRKDMPKHIYDIATLLKSDPGGISIAGVTDGFKRASDEELSYFVDDDRPTHGHILQDLKDFPGSILKPSLFQINNPYSGILGTFRTNLLGSNYPNRSHVQDVLLTRVVAEMVSIESNRKSSERMSEMLTTILWELHKMSELTGKAKESKRKQLRAKYNNEQAHLSMMKNMTVEQALLYHSLVELQKEKPRP